MTLDYDVRDAVQRFPTAARANAVTGTPAVLRARAPAGGALVARALAAASGALAARGAAPLELHPDPDAVVTSAGTAVVHLHQHHCGIPVYESVRSVCFHAGGGAVEIMGDHVEVAGEIELAPTISAVDATMAAARHLADASRIEVSSYKPRVITTFPLPSRPTVLAKRPFADPVTARLVLLGCAPGDVQLGWLVSLATPDEDEQYDLIVGAAGPRAGEILYCKGSFYAARGLARVFRHNPADPGGRVDRELPLPAAAYPALVDAGGVIGRPWIADDRTRGNNAAAFRGNRTGQTLAGVRDAGRVVFAPAEPEGEDQQLLNAFYFCNYLHDLFALLGFGEAEGAFQRENFSGAAGNRDELEVRVFRGPVEGLARLRSRSDGRPGQLLLGVREETGRHTALDADLVYHEYAHGVSNRLVGGRLSGEPLRHPESRALGEGYSDYFALTIQSWQLGREKTVFGAWLAGDDPRGLRRHPYDDGFPLSYADLAAAENQAPHPGGEIWCAALMGMNRALGGVFGDAARGHELGWQLVVDSLKLLPVGNDQPGFLDARDAVARALADLADQDRLGAERARVERAVNEAFARAGMGPSARGRGARFQGIVADFTLPDSGGDL